MPGSLVMADVDTSDVDSYLMQDMENALEDLEPVLVAGNAVSARADAEVLRDGLQYTHEYFVGKGNAEDAVKIAADGQAAIARLFTALDANDLQAAITSARDIAKNCKSCHDIYKP